MDSIIGFILCEWELAVKYVVARFGKVRFMGFVLSL
jgi:hypothetical protein